jgi:hypothetical protein
VNAGFFTAGVFMSEEDRKTWIQLYSAALAETDASLIRQRVEQAREAVVEEWLLLQAEAGPEGVDRRRLQDLVDALLNLQMLDRPDHGRSKIA